MSRDVLLLRAVNVGGRNRVPMAELRDLLVDRCGLSDVQTYIASGNVLCGALSDPVGTAAEVRQVIHDQFGVDTPVIHRRHDELREALDATPFAHGAENLVHAMFLEAHPSDGAVDALRERLIPGEALHLAGRDLWISHADGGVHTTRLTRPVLDKALGVSGTARNLRTVRTLVDLSS